MATATQSTRRKLSLLKLAEELGNVSRACNIMGYHRDTFYKVKRAFQTGGMAALVRGVWLRHNLETRIKRLLRLEAASRENTLVLSEQQIKLLERHSPEFRCRHVEASHPGELLNQDTFYWGTLKGVGKVYVQVVVDVFCSIAFAKLYNSKMPITACHLLYDRVLPFYETLGVSVGAILTDNGREFCGRPEVHPYELLTAMEGIEHRTTKVRSPRTNQALREALGIEELPPFTASLPTEEEVQTEVA